MLEAGSRWICPPIPVKFAAGRRHLWVQAEGTGMTVNVELTQKLLSHRKVLFSYILAIARDHHLAEDLFQEVSVIVLQKGDQFRAGGEFWPFVRGIARRHTLSAIRKKSRRARLLSERSLDVVDRGFDRLKDQAEERHEALRNCLQALPESWRRIVRLRYWEGQPLAKIAATLKRTENAVAVTMNRLRSKLAECVSRKLGTQGEA
jgi:RNA polymerase sigma-70 factor (ECF subfamily)